MKTQVIVTGIQVDRNRNVADWVVHGNTPLEAQTAVCCTCRFKLSVWNVRIILHCTVWIACRWHGKISSERPDDIPKEEWEDLWSSPILEAWQISTGKSNKCY